MPSIAKPMASPLLMVVEVTPTVLCIISKHMLFSAGIKYSGEACMDMATGAENHSIRIGVLVN